MHIQTPYISLQKKEPTWLLAKRQVGGMWNIRHGTQDLRGQSISNCTVDVVVSERVWDSVSIDNSDEEARCNAFGWHVTVDILWRVFYVFKRPHQLAVPILLFARDSEASRDSGFYHRGPAASIADRSS